MSQTPLEVFTQVQLGGMPPLSQMRSFLLQQFPTELAERSISDAKIMGMDNRRTGQLLKQLLYERYLSVPFRLYTFDFEFTGIPRFTAEGPTESIVEIGLFHPESGDSFSTLVKPSVKAKHKMSAEASAITGITDEMLRKEGLPFKEAWKKAWQFLEKGRGPREEPGSEMLMLSHGGKLADVSMLQWALKASASSELPAHVHFGDTFHILRDLHRKRPVTADKFPPSWNLEEVASWMKLQPQGKTHRAEVDAKLTWDVLYHSLDRYGDETLQPKQQLVAKFFDNTARKAFHSAAATAGGGVSNGGLEADSP